MIRRLRWKFTAINMVLVALVLGILIAVVLLTTKNSLYRDSLTALRQALTLSSDDAGSVDDDTSGLFGTDKVQLPYLTVQVYSRTNVVLVLGNQFFDLRDDDALRAVLGAAMQSDVSTGNVSQAGYSLRFLRENNLGGMRIAFVDLTQERSTLASLTRNMVLIGIGALAVFFVISLILARWAVAPVETSWKQQRQFVSDASHELKTPLTVILSSLDMLEDPDADAEKQQRWMDNVRSASEQMRTLVEELLMLARSDNATHLPTLVPCDFSEIVEDELLSFEPIAYEKGKTIEEAVTSGVMVSGDAALLRRIVDIYLDNACKYAPEGTAIRVALTAESKKVTLAVHSAGDPIPPDRLERLYERFYREDASRTEEGYGLGLSIALELAGQHHGRVWAQSDPFGNCFYFSLPRLKEEHAGTAERVLPAGGSAPGVRADSGDSEDS